ncbi:TldD/PmbA family protein [Caenimonas koreensis]|uniref:TldD/PmbA family protein n=1 Tax=Caenimonas koreensis DSM 17982 TaxID=1121255 RepID=A0A844B268_9BURK|nr:TldD/PmbA family protein [Caenimonas koreensis]MRD48818.1 TldD/PmbA family protein [Caenimonas koreensis DSM 17982]
MTYLETRRHELRKRRILMVDGNLTQNLQTVEAGASARVYDNGYWGFASTNDTSPAGIDRVTDLARKNAAAMARFGAKDTLPMPGGSYRGEHVFHGKPAISQKACVQRMSEISAWCKDRYADIKSTRVVMGDEHHTKRVTTSNGGDLVSSIQRALCYVMFTAEGADGAPVELMEVFSCKGSLADLDLSFETIGPVLDALHGHVIAKCNAVAARGGAHTVVLAPELAGMLAHEAMGHPCEADLVLGGAVTGDLVGKRVASDLVTMIDVANTFRGEETMIPVYADDEGTPARDAMLIKDGILTEFMNSRETAARMGLAPTGSARAYSPSDEPLIRMRNTVIVPGTSHFDDMVAGVEDGYVLMKTANGQADSTTEFMFGITLAYEIKDGKVGRAIKDTTLSGSAIKVLQSADAVSNDLSWNCSGYCGKKQPMVVSMGGPALRVRAHLGGE